MIQLREKLQVTPKGVPPLAGQESVTGLEELLTGYGDGSRGGIAGVIG